MPAAAVMTRISLRDEMSSKIDALSARFDKFANRSERAFNRASTSGLRLKSVVGGILASAALMRAFGYLQFGIRGVTEELVSFDHQLTVAAARFAGLAEKGSAGFRNLKQSIIDISKGSQFSPTEIAEAYDIFAKAGFDLNESLKVTPALLDLATISGLGLEQSVETASDALFAFGLRAKEIQDPMKRAEQLQKNITRVSNVMTGAMLRSTTDIEMLYETLKQSGPVAKLASVDIETWAAMATVMAQQGVKASLAGTALKNIYQRMAHPVKDAAKALKEINMVTTVGKTGKLRSFVDMFQELSEKLKMLPDAKRVGILYRIFGRYGVAGAAALASSSKELKRYVDELHNIGDVAPEMAAKIRQSLKNQLLMMRNQIYGIGIAVDEAFRKKYPDAFKQFKDWLSSIDPVKVADRIVYLTDKLVSLFRFIENNWRWLLALAVGYEIASKAAMVMAGQGVLGALIAQLGSARAAGLGFKGALAGVAGSSAVLVGLIGVLGGAVTLLVTRWDEVSSYFKHFFAGGTTWYEKLAVGFMALLNPVFLAVVVFANFKRIVNSVGERVSWLWEKIKSLATTISELVEDLSYSKAGKVLSFLGLMPDKGFFQRARALENSALKEDPKDKAIRDLANSFKYNKQANIWGERFGFSESRPSAEPLTYASPWNYRNFTGPTYKEPMKTAAESASDIELRNSLSQLVRAAEALEKGSKNNKLKIEVVNGKLNFSDESGEGSFGFDVLGENSF